MISTKLKRSFRILFATLLLVLIPIAGYTSGEAEQAAAEEKPYSIDSEGRVDWYTFSGYRRYHAECHVCHGPAGLGSSFAPNLLDTLKTLGYGGFMEVVVNGRVNVNTESQNVMPAFGTNLNVMCFLDDIYAYLYARADNVIGSERPDKQAKPKEATERDAACLGS